MNESAAPLLSESASTPVSPTTLLFTLLAIASATLAQDCGDIQFQGYSVNSRWFRVSPLFLMVEYLLLLKEAYKVHQAGDRSFTQIAFVLLRTHFIHDNVSITKSDIEVSDQSQRSRFFASQSRGWWHALLKVFAITQFVKLLSFKGVFGAQVIACIYMFSIVFNQIWFTLASYRMPGRDQNIIGGDIAENHKIRIVGMTAQDERFRTVMYQQCIVGSLFFVSIFTIQFLQPRFWVAVLTPATAFFPLPGKLYYSLDDFAFEGAVPFLLKIFFFIWAIVLALVGIPIFIGLVFVSFYLSLMILAGHFIYIYLMLGGVIVLTLLFNQRASNASLFGRGILMASMLAWFAFSINFDMLELGFLPDGLTMFASVLMAKSLPSQLPSKCLSVFRRLFALQMGVFLIGYLYFVYDPRGTSRLEWTTLFG